MNTERPSPETWSLEPTNVGTLSPGGQARRDAMLPLLRGAVAARRRRRIAARWVGASAMLALCVASAWIGIPRQPAGAPIVVTRDVDPAESVSGDRALDASVPVALSEAPALVPSPRSGTLVRVVVGDSSIVARVRSPSPTWVPPADDDALAAGLRAAGIRAGVARAGERVMVVVDRAASSG